MAARSNAISELTRFWLEARHGCLLRENVPVPVPYGHSDIDFLAIQGALDAIRLPNGVAIGPRIIVETKDEHDWEPTGSTFGKDLVADLMRIGDDGAIPVGTKSVKFSMLRRQHAEVAQRLFGSDDYDKLFVLHALDPAVLTMYADLLRANRIHVLPIRALLGDLYDWYRRYPRPASLRHTPAGDLWHLLVGFCGFAPPDARG